MQRKRVKSLKFLLHKKVGTFEKPTFFGRIKKVPRTPQIFTQTAKNTVEVYVP
jgi:hypothetical protein